LLEHRLIKLLSDTGHECVFLRGLPQNHDNIQFSKNLRLLNHASDEEFVQLISRSKKLVCRGGYSTIMDLVSLKRTAVLIPTPGQTEQEYLAGYLAERNWFKTIDQEQISLSDLFDVATQVRPELPENNPQKLATILRDQLKLLGIS
jgi:predicted glycosyltransferase